MAGDVGQHRDEPERRHALGLALQLERLDGLDLDGVFHEPVGALADQHLARGRRLLEPRGDVHRVSGDEPLPARGIAGDDLARVHADADLDADAVVAFELVVQDRRAPRASRPPRGRLAPGRPRAERGMPKTAMTASPMNFSTVPPCASITGSISSK